MAGMASSRRRKRLSICYTRSCAGQPAYLASLMLKAQSVFLFLIAAPVVVTITTTVVHADCTPGWTGWYAGGQAAVGWQRRDVGVTSQDPAVFGELPFSVGLDTKGAIGGGQIGYNCQMGARWVSSIEADFSSSAVKGDGTANSVFTNFGVLLPGAYQSVHQQMKWFGTVLGRLGYLASNDLMLYGTAGLAYGKLTHSALHDYTGTGAPFSVFTGLTSQVKAGWVIGGGGELHLTGNWSAKIEYSIFNLGRDTVTQRRVLAVPGDPQMLFSSFGSEGQMVRLGINYKFGP